MSPTFAHGKICYLEIPAADVAETSRRVIGCGGEIVQPHDDEAEEVYALFRDPYGNVLGLYQNSEME